jgi:hypothetical protein
MKSALVGMNARRAGFALSAIKSFCRTTGLNLKEDGFETAAGDLLGDLMHLCVERGKDFHDLVDVAGRYYQFEVSQTCEKCKRKFDAEADAVENENICIECEKEEEHGPP